MLLLWQLVAHLEPYKFNVNVSQPDYHIVYVSLVRPQILVQHTSQGVVEG